MLRQPGTGGRWSNTERDERPGSFFNEVVVLPTLAPHLARPEYLNPNPQFIPIPQPRSQQQQHGVIGVFPSGSVPFPIADEDEAVDDQAEVEKAPGK